MNSKEITSTERLRLRETCDGDVENLLSMFSDPEVMRFYPKRDRAKTVEWIKYSKENYRRYGHSKWILEDRNSGEFIGYCGLLILDIDGVEEVELGYMLKRDKWGKGYATEAAKACLNLAVKKFGYRRVTSIMAAENEASHGVAERLGMKLEKVFSDHIGVERHVFAKDLIAEQ